MEDGRILTLPVHMIRISGIAVNGEPVLEYNCRSVRDDIYQSGVQARKDFIDDEELDIKLSSLPPEVQKAAKDGEDWVQLDPANTFVLQDIKEGWNRYAVPLIASCLKALAKKELISNYENSLLNLGMRTFVHVKYGDPKNEVLPDAAALTAVSRVFRNAMTGTALAVTNNWAEANVIQPDLDALFEYDKYKGVNADILSAGGISGIIVSGRSEDGSTFATAQVSMQTAAIRIKQAKDNFAEMMDKINRRLNRSKAMPHSSSERIPRFTFPPVDLAGSKAFQETCFKLWEKGVLSHETLLQTHGYDIKQEVERKQNEAANGTDEAFTSHDVKSTPNASAPDSPEKENGEDRDTIGRPTLDDNERQSDPAKSETGRQPKASNPEGSKAQT